MMPGKMSLVILMSYCLQSNGFFYCSPKTLTLSVQAMARKATHGSRRATIMSAVDDGQAC
jgi:hypothetical protein